MHKSFLILAILILLVSCSEDDISKTAPGPMIPDELVFAKPVKGQKLSPAQESDLQNHLGGRSPMVVPNAAMVFETGKLSKAQLLQQEASLQAQDENSFQLFKDIQAHCTKQRPTVQHSGTGPYDGDLAFENLKTGDRIRSDFKASIEGNDCPVATDMSYKLDAKASEIRDENTGTINAHASQNGRAIILSPKYAQLFKTRGLILNSEISGLNVRQDSQSKFLFKYSIRGGYMSLTEDIPFNGEATTLVREARSGGQRTTETVAMLVLRFKGLPVYIDIHQARSTAYYVNGHEMPEEDFNKIFGTHSPALNSKNAVAGFTR
jgi:hypothetical protein